MSEVLLQKANYLQSHELKRLKKAIYFAEQAHDGQYRQTGEPYIIHPFAITEILLNYKADITTLIAALLHDVVEDTEYSLEEIESHFGATIRYIVNGLTKGKKQQDQNKVLYEAINFKKLLLSSQHDIRVGIIKVIDRLHNIKTLNVKNPAKQVAYANETLTLFAPLAKRLGLYTIQYELENLAFQYLHKERYSKVLKFLTGYVPHLQKNITDLSKGIHSFCDTNLSFEISYEFPPIYTAYSQLQEIQNVSEVSQICITTTSVLDCYKILGMIHQLYNPTINYFEDNIALENSYFNNNLKTKVNMNNTEQTIIIQTQLAKTLKDNGIFSLLNNRTANVQSISYKIMNDTIVHNNLLTTDPIAFHNLVSYELFENIITAYTSDLQPIYLPDGATIIDFTFSAFPKIAHKMKNAKVNGIPVPLKTKVSHFDIIEIHFGLKQNLALEWLNYANTAKAQLIIQQKLS
ncbi:GTP pyrophosphokinase [[Bacillus thuringiensis] serovar konkukian]|nr:HD domain-containing protein [Bacillus thuringiensis]MED1303424.1 HD domain-containing protein [Bacillus pacificus]OUA95913.1 GTP pyrophosphokinase [[Bacillus thuringiensis] serovar konkukian]